MKKLETGLFAKYNGSRKMLHDFQEHNNVFRIIRKHDNGNKTYPTNLWECEYNGSVRLIMGQDLEIIDMVSPPEECTKTD